MKRVRRDPVREQRSLPPQVTMAAFTSEGSKNMWERGPALVTLHPEQMSQTADEQGMGERDETSI
jgi:hypothetical protein